MLNILAIPCYNEKRYEVVNYHCEQESQGEFYEPGFSAAHPIQAAFDG